MRNPFTNRLIMFFVFILAFTLNAQQSKLSLMPVPESVVIQQGKFQLDKDFTIAVKGDPDVRIYSYATRVLRRLSYRTGLFFSQDELTKADNSANNKLVITCNRPGKVVLGEDESYELKVTSDKIELNAATDLGAMRGLETFLQLLDNEKDYYYLPNVTIKDKPRFQWRGLMMDVSRHFMPVDVIKRNLDAMAAVKMNVFHWHLSDDQGVRLESKVFPKVQELCSDGLYYTQEEVKNIIKYAADRGIRVYPEFDIPGHSTAWFVAFPELASAPGPYKIERNWGVFDPTFNPTIDETYIFFEKLFKEWTALFPDEYFHIGGDENNGKQWKENKDIQKFMQENNIKDNHSLQAYFNNKILKILTDNNKKMIGWDEILHPDMPKNIVIQSWRGTDALVEAAKKGYMGILSNGYYIDLIQPTDYHYLNDPIPQGSNLTDEELKRILGGEVTQWAELVTPENVDSRIWPRTAAIAERFWSKADVRNVEDMYRRLKAVNFRLEELGITNEKNQEMMLRRLTNNLDTAPLKTLVDVIEPVKIYTRHSQGVKYQQFSPYSRVVDVALPDAEVARWFRNDVDGFIQTKDKKTAEALNSHLKIWKENHQKMLKLIEASPILKEIEPMSENLSKVAETGLEAIQLLLSNKKADNEWIKKKTELVEQSKKPYGQTELMITSAIQKLIETVK